jgi:predicted  nucleic acid-binding Zn-ribbon protein
MSEEAVVFIDDKEVKVSELSDQQKYLHSQLLDLRNKEASLKFQLDQVAASMSVFQNAFVEASKEVADEVLKEEGEEGEEGEEDEVVEKSLEQS